MIFIDVSVSVITIYEYVKANDLFLFFKTLFQYSKNSHTLNQNQHTKTINLTVDITTLILYTPYFTLYIVKKLSDAFASKENIFSLT